MTEEQNQTQETATENFEAGSDDEALQLLAKAKEPVSAETEPEDKTEEDVDVEEAQAEPETDEGEEPESEPDTVEVEVNGATYQVPKELKDGYLRQAEFSRNMNEVSEQKKIAEITIKEATQLRESAETYAVELAKVYQLDAQVKSYQNVDWEYLRQNDKAEYAAQAADLRTAELNLERQINATKSVADKVKESSNGVVQAKREEMFKDLSKSIPKWGDAVGTEITNYAINNGFTVDDLTTTTNARFVEAIYKAMQYDKMVKSKDTIKDKIKSVSPVLKPSNSQKSAQDKAPLELFNKNRNSTEAAIAAMSASRR